jgi:proline iminopeptidase
MSDPLNPEGIRTAGIKMIPVMDGQYKVWTKKMGSGPIKVLLLHGGPGFTHQYLEAMESFLPEAGIEMYYYDQLGCGNSDIPTDTALWNTPRFVEEVEAVRQGLGLDDFVLYGQSWGGMLSIEYALKYQQHLRGLVISNMTAGIQAYLRHLNTIKLLLPPEKVARLDALEAAEDYDNPEYTALMMDDLYPLAICRCKPWPESVTRAFRSANLQVYNTMQGKSEFVVTGYFKDWERWDDLHKITVKALTIGARHDTMDPEDLRRMAELMPNAQSAICPNGSHLAMWDDQAFYFEHLLRFLKSLESQG